MDKSCRCVSSGASPLRIAPAGGEDRVGVGLRHARRRLRQLLHESENRPNLAVDGSERGWRPLGLI
jgi:hypothetical protein